jgi:hypothetical protein
LESCPFSTGKAPDKPEYERSRYLSSVSCSNPRFGHGFASKLLKARLRERREVSSKMSDELRLPEMQRRDRSRAVTWPDVPSHVTPSQVQQLVSTFHGKRVLPSDENQGQLESVSGKRKLALRRSRAAL